MKIMIRSEGGIGNQLFQASFAHFLAESHPEFEVVFCDENGVEDRAFALDDFFIGCTHVNQLKSRTLMGKSELDVIRALDRRLFPIFREGYRNGLVKETNLLGFQLGKILEEIQENNIFGRCNVVGNFQCSQYSFPISDCFLGCLTRHLDKNSSQPVSLQIVDVAVHVRRGDYTTNDFYGPLGLRFFEKAISELNMRNPRIVLHSDDPSFTLSDATRARLIRDISFSSNPWDLLRDARDSKAFIGSNSSLSWWAAYLHQIFHPTNAQVTLPDKWNKRDSTNEIFLSLDNWTLLSTIWDSNIW